MWLLANDQGVNVKLDSAGKFAIDANNPMDVFGRELFQHVFLLALLLPVCRKLLIDLPLDCQDNKNRII